MGQKKLKRFAEIKSFPNTLEYPEGMAGRWSEFFKNSNPITLELACGKGEYALGLAKLYPDRNFLGIDLKGNRLWVGARHALREGITNVGFLRIHIDKITDFFAPNEIAEIWITFPDPQLRLSRLRKRLTHPKFLRLYQQILRPGALIHLKTDSPPLYNFTKTVIHLYGLLLHEDLANINEHESRAELRIKTHYEALDIANSRKTHYLRFSLPQEMLPDRDEQLKEMLREKQSESGSGLLSE